MNWISMIFRFARRNPQTVESITSSLGAMVDQLRVHADAHTEKAIDTMNAAKALQDKSSDHQEEARKAREVSAKINALVSA